MKKAIGNGLVVGAIILFAVVAFVALKKQIPDAVVVAFVVAIGICAFNILTLAVKSKGGSRTDPDDYTLKPEVIIAVENYVCKRVNNKILVYNEMYENKTGLLFIVSVLSLFSPGAKDINIPLAIELQAGDAERIVVKDDFSVAGTSDFSCYIPRAHYAKWKLSYLLVYAIILFAVFAIDVLFVYLAVISDGVARLAMTAFLIPLALLSFFFTRKIYAQFALKKKYPVRECALL